MNKVLVTGCAGFIGFHLSKELLKNYHVVGIDNLSNYYDIKLKEDRVNILKDLGIEFKKIDILNQKKLKNLFDINNFEIVFHLAAQAGVRYSLINPYSYIDVNIKGTHNLIEIIRGHKNIKHVIFTSTSSLYGINHSRSAVNEKSDTNNPVSLYAASKKSAESILFSYSKNFKIPISTLRFFTVYGPWGRPDMALFKFIKSGINEEKIDLYNYGEMWRDFTFIEDLITAIIKLIPIIPNKSNKVTNDSLSDIAPYRIINIGNQKSILLNDFVKLIESVIEKKISVNPLPMQEGDVPFTLSDSSLLYNLTEFVPHTEVKEGIKLFYDWYKKYYKY